MSYLLVGLNVMRLALGQPELNKRILDMSNQKLISLVGKLTSLAVALTGLLEVIIKLIDMASNYPHTGRTANVKSSMGTQIQIERELLGIRTY